MNVCVRACAQAMHVCVLFNSLFNKYNFNIYYILYIVYDTIDNVTVNRFGGYILWL